MSKSKKKFKTEVQELLDLVVHSLYSNPDIFLRELISNASDAIDTLRFESLTKSDLIEDDPHWKIRIYPDKDAKTLTISDNGIGMTRTELETNLGTIAHSGSKNFLNQLKKDVKDSPELIGQFGVGFYSAFMVADKVTVVSRLAGESTGAKWISTGDGTYTIEDCEKESRGTEITLSLRDDKKDFFEEWQIKKVVKKFSDFVEYPVTMDISREETPKDKDGNELKDAEKVTVIEEETLNSMKAIWMRPKNEVKDEQYNEFYKHISHDYIDPLRKVHYFAEGAMEFKALLYIPSKAPFDLYFREERKGIHLYVKRIFIMDDCKELMPEYLRFIRGVVESNDLSLNVSREILQEDKIIKKIQKSLVSKILSVLKEMKEKKEDDYLKFYSEFGPVLKEGIHFDFANKEKIQELILFESSNTESGKYVSLKEYKDRMQPEQSEIYYIAGENRDAVENSPHLEIFKSKNVEVLFFTDAIDEWVTQSLTEYDGKKLKAIDRGDIDLDFADDKEKSEDKKTDKKEDKKYEGLLEHIKKKLDNQVKDVKLSNRLTDSACCLVNDEFGMSAHMEKMFKAMNKDGDGMPPTKRILELNSKHPIMKILLRLHKDGNNKKKLDEFVELLYDQALLTEGTPIKNPLKFAQSVSKLMVAEGKSLITPMKKK